MRVREIDMVNDFIFVALLPAGNGEMPGVPNLPSAWEAIARLEQAHVTPSNMARMPGSNVAQQCGVELVQRVGV